MLQNLTVDQLRAALSDIEASFSIAMDNGAESLAMAILDKRNLIWGELVRKIQLDDPFTTEADIRFFEYN